MNTQFAANSDRLIGRLRERVEVEMDIGCPEKVTPTHCAGVSVQDYDGAA